MLANRLFDSSNLPLLLDLQQKPRLELASLTLFSKDATLKARSQLQTHSSTLNKSGPSSFRPSARFTDDDIPDLRGRFNNFIVWNRSLALLYYRIARRASENQLPAGVSIVIRHYLTEPARLTKIQRRLVDANMQRRHFLNFCKTLPLPPAPSAIPLQPPTIQNRRLVVFPIPINLFPTHTLARYVVFHYQQTWQGSLPMEVCHI